MFPDARGRSLAVAGVLVVSVVLSCSGSDNHRKARDDAGGEASAGAPSVSAAGVPGLAGSPTTTEGGAAGGEGGASGGFGDSAGGGGAAVEPTVVATLDQVPISLALDGGILYVTEGATNVGDDGKVQMLPKTAVGATSGGGGITTLASGLREPSTMAVADATVYWLGIDIPSRTTEILAVPTTGGPVTAITQSYTSTGYKIAIANSVLYAIMGNFIVISAFPLAGNAAGAGQVIYTGPAFSIRGIDSDGTSVFFFAAVGDAAGTIDIYQIPIAGGAVTDLAMNVGSDGAGNSSGDCDIAHDATTVYWSNPNNHGVYSVPKTGGTPKLLATFPNNAACPQIALDSNDVYVLEDASLSRFPKSGGTPVTLASLPAGAGYLLSSADSAVAMAIDDTYVYWLSKKMGQVLKLAK
jgi:hypothetical protein